jgi:hypothetical protein
MRPTRGTGRASASKIPESIEDEDENDSQCEGERQEGTLVGERPSENEDYPAFSQLIIHGMPN